VHRLSKLSVALTAAATAVLATGCGSSTSPSNSGLSAQEQAAIISGIVSSGALTTVGGLVAPIAVPLITQTGTMTVSGASGAPVAAGGLGADPANALASTYDAVGIEIVFTVSGVESGAFGGVVGWAGFDASTSTIDELLSSGAFTLGGTTLPTGGSSYAMGTPGQGQTVGTGAYWNRTGGTNGITYLATDGSFSLDAASFSGSSADCPNFDTTKGSCTYTTGTMSGHFTFDGVDTQSGGSWMQPNTTFSIPAVKVNLTLNSIPE
jgi:hypothetical protein